MNNKENFSEILSQISHSEVEAFLAEAKNPDRCLNNALSACILRQDLKGATEINHTLLKIAEQVDQFPADVIPELQGMDGFGGEAFQAWLSINYGRHPAIKAALLLTLDRSFASVKH